MNLRHEVEIVSRAAELKFAACKQLTPCWFCYSADGEHFTLDGPMMDKDLTAKFIRFVFQEKDVVAYIFVDEAWVVEASAAEADKATAMAATIGLEHHPDRREVVVIHAEDASSNMSFHRDIIRPKGARAYLGPLIFHSDITRSEGRFVGMLPRRGPLQ